MSSAVIIDFASRRAAAPSRADIERDRQARLEELVKAVVKESLTTGAVLRQLGEMIRDNPAAAARCAAGDEPIWRPAPKPLDAETRSRLFRDWHTRLALFEAARSSWDVARHLAWARHHSGERNLLDHDPALDAARECYHRTAWALIRTAAPSFSALRWKELRAAELGRTNEIETILSADRAWLEVRSGANRRARLAAGRARRQS